MQQVIPPITSVLRFTCIFFAFQSGAGSNFYARGSRTKYDGATRIKQVRPFIEKDGDVAQLFDKERGKTMAVVGVVLRSH